MKKLIITLAVVFPLLANAQQPLSDYDLNRPIGWGAMSGQEVTGGAGGEEVVVTTEDEFEAAITKKDPVTKLRDLPMIIYIQGEIEFKQMHTWHVKNKTILGLPGSRIYSKDRTKKNSGIIKFSSGSGADCENIILRNLTIQGAGAYDVDGDDALTFQGVKRIWVDHCTIGDGVDGSFDCTHESDYICVTWCHMIYKIDPKSGGSGGANDHRFCSLWGQSDTASECEGHLNTTFANCWWDEGVVERAPRVRFGKVHIINNYYTNTTTTGYSIGYGYKSNIYAEKCWFEDGTIPTKDCTLKADKGYDTYNLQVVGCHGQDDLMQQVGSVAYYNPDNDYTYEGFDVNLVPTVVGNKQTGAGANLMVEVGKGVTGYANGGTTAIRHFDASLSHSADFYSLSGVRQTSLQKGINIVRQQMSDGTTKTIKMIKQ